MITFFNFLWFHRAIKEALSQKLLSAYTQPPLDHIVCDACHKCQKQLRKGKVDNYFLLHSDREQSYHLLGGKNTKERKVKISTRVTIF